MCVGWFVLVRFFLIKFVLVIFVIVRVVLVRFVLARFILVVVVLLGFVLAGLVLVVVVSVEVFPICICHSCVCLSSVCHSRGFPKILEKYRDCLGALCPGGGFVCVGFVLARVCHELGCRRNITLLLFGLLCLRGYFVGKANTLESSV